MSTLPSAAAALRSCPLQKARPAPVMITARMSSSPAASRSASATASSNPSVMALRTLGRLSVSVSTPSSRVARTGGLATSVDIGSTLVARRCSSIRGATTVFAQLAQRGVRVYAGVVAVGPHDVQAIRADERYVRQLVLARLEQRLHGKPPRKARLALARRARARPAQHIERDPISDAVGPLDQQCSIGLVVIEANRPQLRGWRAHAASIGPACRGAASGELRRAGLPAVARDHLGGEPSVVGAQGEPRASAGAPAWAPTACPAGP